MSGKGQPAAATTIPAAAVETDEQQASHFATGSFKDGVPYDGEQTAEEAAALAADAARRAGKQPSKAAQEAIAEESDEEADAETDPEETDEESDAEAATEETDEEADPEAEKPTKAAKPAKAVQARINHFRRMAGDAERRAAVAEGTVTELQRRLDAIEQRLPGAEKSAKVQNSDTAPDPKEFEFGELDAGYIRALSRYETRQEIKAERERAAQSRQSEAAEQDASEFQAKGAEFHEQGTKRFDDFEEVVVQGAKDLTWVMSDDMGKLIFGSKVGPEIAYHLATHPKLSRELFGKTPLEQAAAFGRLEAQFSPPSGATTKKPKLPAEPAKQAPVVKTSKAPTPIHVARGSGGNKVVTGASTDFSAVEAMWNETNK
jgi:hypothetical protein